MEVINIEGLRELANKQFKSSVVKLGTDRITSDIKGFIPTGWTLLDCALGGGLALGRTTEIFGYESSGKSTLVYSAIANCQEMGGVVILLDSEVTFPKDYAASLGVNPDNIMMLNTDTYLEQVFELIVKVSTVVRSKIGEDRPIMFVWDTLAATPSKMEMEAMSKGEEFTRGVNPFRAQTIKAGMRVVTAEIAESAVSLVIVNHVYDSMGPSFTGPQTTTPGGRGVKFHATQRLHVKKAASLKDSDKNPIGHIVSVKIEKNKIGIPQKKLETRFIYGIGYDNRWSIFDYLVENGMIKKSSSWYSLPLTNGEYVKCYSTSYLDILAANDGLYEHLCDLAVAHFRVHGGLVGGEE